jgi:hypothetical protein
MADLSDVMLALAQLISGTIYPNGTAQPSAVIVGGAAVPARIYPGWPIPAQLDADLAAGTINVSVFAPPGTERNTTRYPRQWVTATPATVTLTATVDATGTMVTLGGTVSTPQNVAIIVDGQAVVYSVQSSDTLAAIAASLATLLAAAGITATSSGAVVTIVGARGLVARVGGVAGVIKELSRQDRLFQITFWCSSPAARDGAVKLVDPVLRGTNFLDLVDGTGGRLIYQRTFLDDGIQKVGCYRRDLFYTVEYGTTIAEEAPQAIVAETSIQGAAAPFADFTTNDPPPFTEQS